MTTSKRYTVAQSTKTTGFDIHAHGCHHTAKQNFGRILGTATAPSPETLRRGLARDMADNDRTENDFRIMSCCQKAAAA